MDVCAFFRICVIFFSIDIIISEDGKNASTSKSLLELCFEEEGSPLDSKLKELSLFEQDRVTACMNVKYETLKQRRPSENQTIDDWVQVVVEKLAEMLEENKVLKKDRRAREIEIAKLTFERSLCTIKAAANLMLNTHQDAWTPERRKMVEDVANKSKIPDINEALEKCFCCECTLSICEVCPKAKRDSGKGDNDENYDHDEH